MARKKKEEKPSEKKKPTVEIEAYDEDRGGVILKDDNKEGLIALVKLVEEVQVEQDHDANVKVIGFNGNLNVENPSSVDRLWDIDITLSNIEGTNLKSEEINIKELGITDDDNVDSREFQIAGEAKNLLLVKEYISTMPNADDVLNINDIESDLLRIKEEASGAKAEKFEAEIEEEAEPEEEEEEDEDEETDAGTEDYSLESFGISINTLNTVTFAIGIHSLFEKPITDLKITKNITPEFENIKIVDSTQGSAEIEGDQIIWTIDEIESETTVLLKLTADILVETKEPVKTGIVEVSYKAESSFTGGLAIEKFNAYTNNKHYVDMMEKDESPGIWDCNLVFENPSEFFIKLFDIDVHAPEAPDTKFIEIDEESMPTLPDGAEWHSAMWEYENEDYPAFRKEINFTVLSELQAEVSGTIAIDDVELGLASITGVVSYEVPGIPVVKVSEKAPAEVEAVAPEEIEVEEKGEILEIRLPSYTETDIEATLTLTNDGSTPLNEVKLNQKAFDDYFRPPNPDDPDNPDEIKLIWDGKEVELDPDAVKIDEDSIIIDLKDLKDSPTGMFEPDSTIEVKFPIHAVSPPSETEFETDVVYNANTYPIGTELEYLPIPEEIPRLVVIHIRRKYRLVKEIVPIGEFGNYKIVLLYENLGDMPLKDFVLIDKVPDNFKYSNFSLEPEITDDVGTDTLKWSIELLEESEQMEISYEIKGSGEYHPSEAQLAF